ncbi:putative alpha/beta hydrolase [Lentinula detonsa]|uniref:Alpha/beta hydrolase n=1 Tax=Lentinula detonsa TaxID=2804962 RepID=A0A9W8NYH8_9AGAR|nr:putative alpha/beta hydrolase [Lentinula detonsa]
MSAATTTKVPHLGGVTAGYRMSGDRYDITKPTTVLVNSMCTTVSLFNDMYSNTELTNAMNLLAIEPLGHGATSCPTEHFTYWDSAIIALQVMDNLGIDKAFAFGESQGGWIVVRMALLAPARILGLMPTGTSMDSESEDSRRKGAWDPKPLLNPFLEKWSSVTPTPDFVIDDVWCGMVTEFGFPRTVTTEKKNFWTSTLKSVYKEDEGRKKAKVALICLLERDSLLLRLRDIKCPVHWLQGTQDIPYGLALASEQIRLFTSSEEAKLEIVEGGSHYLNTSNPIEVGDALQALVKEYTKAT